MSKYWQRLPAKVRDIIERALSSFGQQALTVLLAGQLVTSVTGLPWVGAATTGAGAAVISVLLTYGQYAAGWTNLPVWVDRLVRAGKTFAASLLATFGGGDQVLDILKIDWTQAINVAALATVLAVAKGFLGPNTASASLLTERPPTEAPPAVHVPEHEAP